MDKNYKDILSEGLTSLKSNLGNESGQREATGKILSALTLVIGDISENLNSLNTELKSNSISTKKAANASIFLTSVLIFFTAVQAGVAYIGHAHDIKIEEERTRCFTQALNTSNLDQNYRNCLHNNGIE